MSTVTQLPPTRPRLVNVKDVAAYLGLAKSTVYELAKEDRIPHRRIGGRVKFDMSEIDDWLDRTRRGPKA